MNTTENYDLIGETGVNPERQSDELDIYGMNVFPLCVSKVFTRRSRDVYVSSLWPPCTIGKLLEPHIIYMIIYDTFNQLISSLNNNDTWDSWE